VCPLERVDDRRKGVQHPVVKCNRCGHGAVANAKFSINVFHVTVNCVRTEGQRSGDFLVAFALRKLTQNILLSNGQRQ